MCFSQDLPQGYLELCNFQNSHIELNSMQGPYLDHVRAKLTGYQELLIFWDKV